MTAQPSKYRFLFINAFSLAPGNDFQMRSFSGPKETQIYNYEDLKPFLADIDWDLHPGAPATHGNWPVTTKEAFMSTGNNRLPLVREACASGRYNAIVLLGGGDPGYMELREIARQYRIPVTSSAHAQMHVAGLLGNKFSIVDIAETHNMQMYHLVVQYRMTERCASIRNVNYPLPNPNFPNDRPIQAERDRAVQSGSSDMLEAAVTESIAAIEEDGAEVDHARLFRGLLDAAAAAEEAGRDRLGRARARRRALRHRGRPDPGRSRRRCQRPRLPERAPREMAAQKGLLGHELACDGGDRDRGHHDRQTQAARLDGGASHGGRSAARAQPEYPSEPIKSIVPRAPGGGSDIIARLLQPGLEKKLGVPVISTTGPMPPP